MIKLAFDKLTDGEVGICRVKRRRRRKKSTNVTVCLWLQTKSNLAEKLQSAASSVSPLCRTFKNLEILLFTQERRDCFSLDLKSLMTNLQEVNMQISGKMSHHPHHGFSPTCHCKGHWEPFFLIHNEHMQNVTCYPLKNKHDSSYIYLTKSHWNIGAEKRAMKMLGWGNYCCAVMVRKKCEI